jgi:uncharacterized membrane protein YGL010W
MTQRKVAENTKAWVKSSSELRVVHWIFKLVTFSCFMVQNKAMDSQLQKTFLNLIWFWVLACYSLFKL